MFLALEASALQACYMILGSTYPVLGAWSPRARCTIRDSKSLELGDSVQQVGCTALGNVCLAPESWVLLACHMIPDNMCLAQGALVLSACYTNPRSSCLELQPCVRMLGWNCLSSMEGRRLEVEWGSLPSGE